MGLTVRFGAVADTDDEPDDEPEDVGDADEARVLDGSVIGGRILDSRLAADVPAPSLVEDTGGDSEEGSEATGDSATELEPESTRRR
jgi:hypothetical protein